MVYRNIDAPIAIYTSKIRELSFLVGIDARYFFKSFKNKIATITHAYLTNQYIDLKIFDVLV